MSIFYKDCEKIPINLRFKYRFCKVFKKSYIFHKFTDGNSNEIKGILEDVETGKVRLVNPEYITFIDQLPEKILKYNEHIKNKENIFCEIS